MLERLRLREGWLSLILLLFVLLSMAWSFTAGGLAEGLRILPSVVLLGVLIGFAFAKSPVPGLLVHPLALAIGATVCFLLLSTLVVLPAGTGIEGVQPDSWLATLESKGLLLSQRLQAWVQAALQGQINADALPFVAQMTAMSWLLGFYGAWFLFRSHWVWGAVLPPGLATFLSVYYAPPRLMVYFMLYLLWSLVLVVRVNVYRRESEWQRHHVIYDQYIGLEFLRDGAILSLIVVALIWLIPRPNAPGRLSDQWQRLQGPWQRVQQEWQRLYASLSYQGQRGTASFGRTLTLSGAVNLSTIPVMEVQAPEGRYWRAVVMDRYTGSGWVDTSRSVLQFGAGEPLTYWGTYQARKVMLHTVTMVRTGDALVFAAAEPVQVQLATRVHGTRLGEEAAAGDAFQVSAVYAPELGRQNRYVVRSMVSVASVRGLTGAGTAYPDWVGERYLQLPEDLPARIGELAARIAADEITPYDQATAIETYLRQLRYSQLIDNPPGGRDPVDWFLFDTEEGYCTYYASAMVLMCRTLGLPARFAQGYATGEYVPERGAFVVREADAHAWPELYFPGYGWIAFEPTPSQPPIIRPTGDEEPDSDTAPGLPPGANEPEEDFGPDMPLPPLEDLSDVQLPGGRPFIDRAVLIQWAVLGLLAALLVGLAWRYVRRWSALRPTERLYARLTWVSGVLGVSAHPYQTPLEFGRRLAGALGRRGDPARQIVQLYVRDRYGRRRATTEEVMAATSAWRRLRPTLIVQALRHRIDAWRPGGRGGTEPEPQSGAEVRPQ